MNTRTRFITSALAVTSLFAGCRSELDIINPVVSEDGPADAPPRFSPWSAPVNLGPTVNSAFTDFGPAMSRDGRSLYFSSDRPGGLGGLDLWVVRRASVDQPWDPPANLGPGINSSSNEGAPSTSRDGHVLIFFSNRPGGVGGNDLWLSRRFDVIDDFAWGEPVNMGPVVNGPGFDAGGQLRLPDLFLASDRGSGTLDLFVTRIGRNGAFGPPVLLTELRSDGDDARPSVRFDGLELFFHSNRPEAMSGSFDIWTAMRQSDAEQWSTPVNLGDGINTAFVEVQPFISADGQVLLFASNRPGGSGALDLYAASRVSEPR